MTRFIVYCSAGDGPHKVDAGDAETAVRGVLASDGHENAFVGGLSDCGISADEILNDLDERLDPVCEDRCPGGWRGMHALSCPVEKARLRAVGSKVAADIAANGPMWHRAVAEFDCPVCLRKEGKPCVWEGRELVKPHEPRIVLLKALDGMQT